MPRNFRTDKKTHGLAKQTAVVRKQHRLGTIPVFLKPVS